MKKQRFSSPWGYSGRPKGVLGPLPTKPADRKSPAERLAGVMAQYQLVQGGMGERPRNQREAIGENLSGRGQVEKKRRGALRHLRGGREGEAEGCLSLCLLWAQPRPLRAGVGCLRTGPGRGFFRGDSVDGAELWQFSKPWGGPQQPIFDLITQTGRFDEKECFCCRGGGGGKASGDWDPNRAEPAGNRGGEGCDGI